MTNHIEYYKYFPSLFHEYKVIGLDSLLKTVGETKSLASKDNLSKEEIKSIEYTFRIEIRQTYYHCVETLFELINALKPDDQGNVFDDEILQKLVHSKKNAVYTLVESISKNENVLDFLENFINNEINIKIWQHIFFYKFKYNIQESCKVLYLEKIKQILKISADILSNRDEYNNYKHGLRFVPVSKTMTLKPRESEEKPLIFKMDNAVTFLKRKSTEDKIEFSSLNLDTEKDIKMTILCSKLIYNIIESRKAYFCNQKFVDLFIITDTEFNEAVKNNVIAQNFTFTIDDAK